ncbi:MAG: CHC2 zinc finger domain-containing protein, partial [Chloroflexi bacterium]|nr:CHC2 zinc finger domain-containing protein [Chloroflexota bacterium]
MTLVDEVKARTDIVQVISQYADLDTRSRTPKAPCPFHSERTPSFVVFPDSGTWRCFGSCSTGGDVISFVMRKENLQFGEALKHLADRA